MVFLCQQTNQKNKDQNDSNLRLQNDTRIILQPKIIVSKKDKLIVELFENMLSVINKTK
jgi:hypothetical protein